MCYSDGIFLTMRQEIQDLCFSLSINCLKWLDHQKSQHTKSDILGVKTVDKSTKLYVHFSALNEHRFKHAFDCLSPLCFCGKYNENNEHFLLHCPLYNVLRRDLFDQLSDVPGLDVTSINNMDDDTLCH